MAFIRQQIINNLFQIISPSPILSAPSLPDGRREDINKPTPPG
jgi:hypothetical protein